MKSVRLVKNTSLYFLGNICSRAVGFLMIPVYTHYLSPADYGVIELIDLFIVILCISLGMQSMFSAMVRVYHEQTNDTDRQKVVSTALLGNTVLGLLICGSVTLFASQVSQLIFSTTAYATLLTASLWAMYLSNLAELALVYQRMMERALFYVSYSLSTLVVALSLNIYFIAWRGMGIWGFVTAKLITVGAGSLFLVPLLVKKNGLHWDFKFAVSMAKFGGPLIFSGAAFFVIHFSDRFFLNHYAPLSELGVYSLAYKFAFLITYLVGEPFGRAWNVRVFAYAKEDAWKERFARVVAALLFCLTFAGSGLALFANQLLGAAAGAAFARAALVIPVLAFAYVLRESGDFFRDLLYINKRVVRVSGIATCCALANIALNFLLIPRFHMEGAAWATFGTWGLYAIGMSTFAQREHHLPLSVWQVAKLAAGALAVWVLHLFPLGSSRWVGWVQNAALLCLFAAFVWFSGYFLPNEKVLARDFARQLYRLAIDRLKRVLYAAGAMGFYHRLRNSNCLTVIMFHRILPADRAQGADMRWTVTLDVFGECLDFFRKHYNPVSIEDVQAWVEKGRRLPRRPLLVTFDDGWADNEEYALEPLLSRHVPAVVFVTSHSSEGDHAMWQDCVWKSCESKSDIRTALWAASGGGAEAPAAWQADHSAILVTRLESMENSRRMALLAEYREPLRLPRREEMLSGDQIRRLSEAGIAIGSHGATHISIPFSSDPSAELRRSRFALAEVVGGPGNIDTISFPNGSWNCGIVEQARESGYTVQFTSNVILNQLDQPTDLYGRISLGDAQIAQDGRLRRDWLALKLFRPSRQRLTVGAP